MSNVTDIVVPDLGDFEDVEVIEVLVSVGDHVAREDGLITLETDKAAMDVPAPEHGTIEALTVSVGDPCLINEFHDPTGSFHQVDIYFRCQLVAGTLNPAWTDPARVVTERRLFTREEMAHIKVKPDSLAEAAWGEGLLYDPLEPILR